MRRPVKLLANFLGAAKDLTDEYSELAEVTDDEKNQIRMSLTSRPDRKMVVPQLAAKGYSTRDIAAITGWSHETIAADLRQKSDSTRQKSDTSTTVSDETVSYRAGIAAAAAAAGVTAAPTDKYRIIYADPPWAYGNTMPEGTTQPDDHYPLMPLQEICALPVKDWAEDNAVLFLWATSPILGESFEVIRAWGFTYKASFVWDKIKHNMGHYNSVRHEFLLICTRGSCQPDKQQLFDSVQNIERGKHSEKPVEFYDIIETIYTHGRKLELFCRERRDGWDAYGHRAHIPMAAE